MAKAHPGFTLSQLIETTADELRAASKKADDDAVMQFEGCELELAVTVGAEGETGIKFWLVSASARAKAETISKIKLSFGPVEGKPAQAFKAQSPGKKGPKVVRRKGQ